MSGEKTEQPTQKRLRDAREKGQVPKSQEVPSAAVVLSLALYFIVRGGDLMDILKVMAEGIFKVANQPFEVAWPHALSLAISAFFNVLGPLIPLIIVVSALSNLGQVGILISFKAAMPKMENLSPAKWFKKTFSKSNLFDLLKNVVKVVVLTVVIWKIMSKHWGELFYIPGSNAKTLGAVMGSTLQDLVLMASAAFAVLAAIDFIYQRLKFTKDNMMSKEEVKREYKEMEGDPLIKSKRKQLHQEMASQNSVGQVRKAKVLVTNPTHYAVALDYEDGRTPLPVILAKAEGELAKRMISEAKRLGVPIMRDVTLARSLFEEGLENSYIPKNLIGPVAEVLRWVNTLKAK